MRAFWKQSEEMAVDAFALALKSKGIQPLYDPQVTDSPDSVFLVDKQRIAVECRYITPSNVLSLLGKRILPIDQYFEIILPLEPHLWVKDAITKKNKNVPKYLVNGQATEAWLLLHSSSLHRLPIATNDCNSEVIKLLQFGAYMQSHDFTRIWFADIGNPDNPPAFEIYGPGYSKPNIDPDDYISKHLPSYPLQRLVIGHVTLHGKENEPKRIKANLNNDIAEQIFLQPLDKRYRLDYTAFKDSSIRNSNLKNLSYTLLKDRPAY